MTLSSDKVETVVCESKANILKLFKSIGNSLGNAFWSYFDLKMNDVRVEKWLFLKQLPGKASLRNSLNSKFAITNIL